MMHVYNHTWPVRYKSTALLQVLDIRWLCDVIIRCFSWIHMSMGMRRLDRCRCVFRRCLVTVTFLTTLYFSKMQVLQWHKMSEMKLTVEPLGQFIQPLWRAYSAYMSHVRSHYAKVKPFKSKTIDTIEQHSDIPYCAIFAAIIQASTILRHDFPSSRGI